VVLSCGKEEVVAATNSVMEQALFFDSLLHEAFQVQQPLLTKLSEEITPALTINIDPRIVGIMANAPVIYFAGRNNGTAEEFILKTNEIIRKNRFSSKGLMHCMASKR
jgi:glutamine---fructose-6-phosphate transaminase (isomerizing)